MGAPHLTPQEGCAPGCTPHGDTGPGMGWERVVGPSGRGYKAEVCEDSAWPRRVQCDHEKDRLVRVTGGEWLGPCHRLTAPRQKT